MASVIEICNRALDKLGQGSITSLGDGTTAANLCNRNYAQTRDQMLRDHPWNFAVRRAQLAPSSSPPSWGFSNRFPLPNDCLRLLEVDGLSTAEYQVEGKSILSNGSVLRIRYIRRVDDPNDFDAAFIDALATGLAHQMCEAITQSNQKKQILAQDFEDAMTRAKRADGQENPPTMFEEDDWIKVRY